jgi:endonuclease YncB( thermonuclease family)
VRRFVAPLPLTAAVAVAAVVAVLGLTPSAAEAGTAGTVRVVRVIDGDTIDVDSNGDGRIDARIRLLGLDAPEHGLCNFTAAKHALTTLVRHKHVELRSDRGRTGILNRPERRVIVPIAGGRTVDASTWMLQRGWGVWMPRNGELTLSHQQHVAADQAAARTSAGSTAPGAEPALTRAPCSRCRWSISRTPPRP